jgi:preprotein translocase subunit YajC
MLSKVRRNDVIVTNGGLVGTVTKVIEDKDELLVEIAEGVKVRVVRSMITDVRAKTEPANTDSSSDKKAASEEKK